MRAVRDGASRAGKGPARIVYGPSRCNLRQHCEIGQRRAGAANKEIKIYSGHNYDKILID